MLHDWKPQAAPLYAFVYRRPKGAIFQVIGWHPYTGDPLVIPLEQTRYGAGIRPAYWDDEQVEAAGPLEYHATLEALRVRMHEIETKQHQTLVADLKGQIAELESAT